MKELIGQLHTQGLKEELQRRRQSKQQCCQGNSTRMPATQNHDGDCQEASPGRHPFRERANLGRQSVAPPSPTKAPPITVAAADQRGPGLRSARAMAAASPVARQREPHAGTEKHPPDQRQRSKYEVGGGQAD